MTMGRKGVGWGGMGWGERMCAKSIKRMFPLHASRRNIFHRLQRPHLEGPHGRHEGVRPDSGSRSEGAGGAVGRLTLLNTATSQGLLKGT